MRGKTDFIAGGPVSDGGYFTKGDSGTLTLSVDIPDGSVGFIELEAHNSAEVVPAPVAVILAGMGLGVVARIRRGRNL